MFGTFTNVKLNFKRAKFTHWKGRNPTYYEIHFWAWLYNLSNMIVDWFSLPKGYVRARIEIRKDLIEAATKERESMVFQKIGEFIATQNVKNTQNNQTQQ